MRIALVDPSRTTRLIVSRMLEARDHEVVSFADEREALRQIEIDLRIDALITSAELQHMSGLELCWETRLIATHRRPIYVLMMSSQYDQRTLVEALDSGATTSSASRRSPKNSMRACVLQNASPRCSAN
ncbi:response regulator [Methyloceanibacter superfactus]|uniref:response regulator n=1 Tax=Methyloceanibacter superfactus TaxID=1774969 RepID=UPI001FCDF9D2